MVGTHTEKNGGGYIYPYASQSHKETFAKIYLRDQVVVMVTMSVVEQLRRRVEDSPTEFECGLCDARYERRRMNCPACGSEAIREA